MMLFKNSIIQIGVPQRALRYHLDELFRLATEKPMRLLEKINAWAKRIKRDAVTLWFAYKHPGTPLVAKALCIFVVAYALSPIDLVPDFIPILGYVDEALLLPALIWLSIKMVPPAVLDDCRRQGDEWMAREGRKPRTYWGVVLVIAIWIAIAWSVWAFVVAPKM